MNKFHFKLIKHLIQDFIFSHETLIFPKKDGELNISKLQMNEILIKNFEDLMKI